MRGHGGGRGCRQRLRPRQEDDDDDDNDRSRIILHRSLAPSHCCCRRRHLKTGVACGAGRLRILHWRDGRRRLPGLVDVDFKGGVIVVGASPSPGG